jgi:ubiquitin carboxyl-terminal hydrolase 10
MHEPPAVLPQPVQVYPVASPSPRWEPKSSLPPKPNFTAPVSSPPPIPSKPYQNAH